MNALDRHKRHRSESLKIVNLFSKCYVIFDVLSSDMLQYQIFFSQLYNMDEKNFSRNKGVQID